MTLISAYFLMANTRPKTEDLAERLEHLRGCV
jgi:hypothetical protein